MDILSIYHDAKKTGSVNDSKMIESIEAMTPMLEQFKAEHPEEYWKMMRRQHEIMLGHHYSEDFANYDVGKLHWTGKDGQKHNGAHWSKEQVVDATKGMTFPSGTTDCDKYVAFNVFFSDMSNVVADETDIIKQAHTFFFLDEDAPTGKIWRYMMAMCR